MFVAEAVSKAAIGCVERQKIIDKAHSTLTLAQRQAHLCGEGNEEDSRLRDTRYFLTVHMIIRHFI